ncbi:zinc-dependent alcohol dehydrogenase [Nonomuraea sp. ZG12]|uniref:zinc-dependent alcohol dehydrogenase n=1 Tax=Nonomuraea sp. ZG12 TaxID=3452207 RepID=UPI003F8BC4BD
MVTKAVSRNATMRAAVWTAPGRVDVRDVPYPHVPDGWLLLRVEYGGICGTDLAIVAGRHPRATAPLVIGHEIVGTVERTGPDGPPAGTRAVVEPLIACGRCRACRDQAAHVCRELELFGIDEAGGLADYMAVPADRVVPVRPGVPVRRAAWAEPLAVAVHSVAQARMRGGESVLVFGAGPIGILVALVAREAGAARIVIAEPKASRRRTAAACGFETVPDGVDPATWFRSTNASEGADIVFDTAGHPDVARVLPASARETGTIVLVAVYPDPVALDLRALCFGERRLLGSRVYTRDDLTKAVALLPDDPLGLDRLPVAVFPLDEAAAAFHAARAGDAPMKVLLDIAARSAVDAVADRRLAGGEVAGPATGEGAPEVDLFGTPRGPAIS